MTGTDYRAWLDDPRALVTAEDVLAHLYRKR